MFTFQILLKREAMVAGKGLFGPSSSTKRLSSIADDLNSFSSGAESIFSFARVYAGRSFGLLLTFAAR
jgi:hypothetical protein